MSAHPEDTRRLLDLWADLTDRPTDAGTEVAASANPTAEVTEATLVHIHPPGPGVGRRYRVGRDPLVVGRQADCGIVDPESSVSRAHARIQLGPAGRFTVTDLGSTNGTFVNRERVTAADLRDGDYVGFGSSLYRFLAGGNVEADYHEVLHRLAISDPLTGLPNRRAMAEFLSREVPRARRRGRPVALVLFDIDHFKQVNDRLGHLAGDAVLRGVAELARPLVRQEELLARYGGEEFAVVLPETDAAGAARCGERIRGAVEAHPFVFETNTIAVTVSGGVGCITPGESVADLLARADERLYAAKKAGRNQVC